MTRNSASGANKQRRRPQREDSGTNRWKVQPGHTNPDLRLDGQTTTQSFEPLERSHKSAIVVGQQGWKSKENDVEPGQAAQVDVWDQLWGDAARPAAKVTRIDERQTITRMGTPELSKHHPGIPKSGLVVPGKLVDVVLKKDQGTGRTVKGVISEVLTRGDHPRGIKVRLMDGQVGRVQKVH
jgi:uncharacterized repeat protein (TIGR03833 family)